MNEKKSRNTVWSRRFIGKKAFACQLPVVSRNDEKWPIVACCLVITEAMAICLVQYRNVYWLPRTNMLIQDTSGIVANALT